MEQPNPPAPKPSELLASALKLLGGGRNWTKGRFKEYKASWLPFLGWNYCALGAVIHVNTERQAVASAYLERASHKLSHFGVATLNDRDNTTFDDIDHLFKLAIELAKADGN